ncbi:MAG: hypothetical protein ABSC10_13825 [Candidatus Acidiferrales bacterium]|jgi:hypothetical protein
MATKQSSKASKARRPSKSRTKRIPSVTRLNQVRPLLMTHVCIPTEAM